MIPIQNFTLLFGLGRTINVKADFLSSQKLLATILFSKEISQVMLAAMVLAPNFYCKNCQRVISAMRGNPPLEYELL